MSENDFVTSFNKHIFSSLASRIKEGKSLTMSAFSQVLSDDELSVLAGLEAKGRSLSNPGRECVESIKTLKEQKRLSERPDLETISDEEFRALFEN